MSRKYLSSAAFVAIAFFLLSCPAFSASPGKVEPTGAFDDASASSAAKAALQPKGYRLSLYDGNTVEVWLRQMLPLAKEKDPNALYPQFGRSTFVGVIRFTRQTKDFRGQILKPGAYAMRYELLPNDGNHMGRAAQPDFFLLTPLTADTHPAADVDFGKLVELSGKASGTGHPASLSLVPTDGAGVIPSLFYTSDGYVAFAMKIDTSSGELPFALVVKGVAEQ